MENMNKPAYPIVNGDGFPSNIEAVDPKDKFSTGLTKLEAFTMAAMQGMCANSDYTAYVRREQPNEILMDVISRECVNIAKATLKSLEEDGKQIANGIDYDNCDTFPIEALPEHLKP